MERFHELFSQTKYKEAAELAAESPQGILRTPDTVAKFQVFFFIRCSYSGFFNALSVTLVTETVARLTFRHMCNDVKLHS